jgi:hypothetical protein
MKEDCSPQILHLKLLQDDDEPPSVTGILQ